MDAIRNGAACGYLFRIVGIMEDEDFLKAPQVSIPLMGYSESAEMQQAA